MATLRENMEAIQTEKNTKIKPDNIKSGITAFGIKGTYEGKVLLFDSMDKMNASTPAINTYGVVMGTILEPMDEEDLPFKTLTLQRTITLSETVAAGTTYALYTGSGSGCQLEIQLTRTSCVLRNQDTSTDYARYTSSDGKTYRQSYGSTTLNISTTITTFYPGYMDNRLCLEFLTLKKPAFLGLYQYKSSSTGWVLAENQFTGTASDLYMDKIVYSKEGAIIGTLGFVVSNMFDDTSAKIYKKTKQEYENMTPTVLTDTDTINKTIQLIPTNSDNETLLDLSQRTTCTRLFENCIDLSEVAPLDLSNCTIMTGMFTNCSKIEKIVLNNVDKIVTCYYPFTGCTGLKYLELNGDLKCAYLDDMFEDMISVEEIANVSASEVTYAMHAFNECAKLRTLKGLYTPNAISYGEAFENCVELVDVPILEASKLGTGEANTWGTEDYAMVDMFLGCTKLSDESLNNILQTCINAENITTSTYKTLAYIGLTEEQATKCQTLSNYEAFVTAGWTTGY